MSATSIYVPSQSSNCLLPLLKRSAIVSDPDLFQISISVLGLRTCESFHMPFKSEVSVCQAPMALLYTRSVGLQNQMFWGFLVSLMQDSQVGEPDMRLIPITLWGEPLQLCLSSQFLDHLPGNASPDYIISLPSFPSPCGFFFVSLIVESIFCLSAGQFHKQMLCKLL